MNNRWRTNIRQRKILVKLGLERYDITKPHKCPVCGHDVEDSPYAPCFHCGWECDPIQNRHPDIDGGPNEMSLNEAREAYKKGEPVR